MIKKTTAIGSLHCQKIPVTIKRQQRLDRCVANNSDWIAVLFKISSHVKKKQRFDRWHGEQRLDRCHEAQRLDRCVAWCMCENSDWIAAFVCAKTAIGSLCCCVFRVVYMFIVFCMQLFDSQEQCVYCSNAQASH